MGEWQDAPEAHRAKLVNDFDVGATGLPVGNPQIGRNGILVPVKNANALATAMEFFIKHPEQIAIMGRESRCYAKERYDVHKVNAVILNAMGLRK